MVKNGICLGGASQQNALFFNKCAPKNAPMTLMSRIGPAYFISVFLTLSGKINGIQTNAGHDNTEHALTTNLACISSTLSVYQKQ